MDDPHAHYRSLPAPPRGLPPGAPERVLPEGREGADASLGAKPAPEGAPKVIPLGESPLGGREAS
jgi:hypothetical protein